MLRLAACVLVLTAACGSRSGPLTSYTTSPGTGGSAGPSSGGASPGSGGALGGAAGASGGTGGACNALELDAFATIDSAWKHDAWDPVLTLSSDDGQIATLMFRWQPLQTQPGVPPPHPKLGHIDFNAWLPWPKSLGAAAIATSYGTGVEPAALGDAPGSAHAFLLYDDGSLIGPEGMAFVPSALTTEPAKRVELGPIGRRPLFVSRGPKGHLIGFERFSPASPENGLTFGRFADGVFSPYTSSGCMGDTLLQASAARVPGGHLVAFSSSHPFGACADPSSESVSQIQVARLPDDTAEPSLAFVIDKAFSAGELQLLATTDLVWLVWSDAFESLHYRKLDWSGSPLGPGGVLPGKPWAMSWGLTALGSRLVGASTSGEKLTLSLWSEDGEIVHSLEQALPPELPIPYLSRTVIAAPDGSAVIFAWADNESVEGRAIRLARFRCVSS